MPGPEEVETTAPAASARAPATLRLPPFSASEPELWPLQVQFAFDAAGISDDLARFRILAANLPMEVARDVKDKLMTNQPSYACLTKALKDRMMETRAERLQKLLQHQHFGDQKPSQLLRRMKAELGSDGADDSILRQLFLNRLSPVTRAAVAILPDDARLEDVATAADRFLQAQRDTEKSPLATLSAASAPAQEAEGTATLASLQTTIAALTASVTRLDASLQARPREGAAAASPPPFRRNRSRSRSRNEVCFYHAKFGAAARKCKPPCSFSGNSQA
ncbi:hypothetical protein FJT64_019269 [Amphibalanus amphitrite]|uniref:DUF7041 domain-containing protein n=1 Tax=Amphibalanus amphitrite TaxID=1232801 RepID=A0A6A4WS76_AMPAM|nr:hypothetical protein FJT64_019269 [Amphibalanus amphitrite]